VTRLARLFGRGSGKANRGSGVDGELPNTESTRICPHCGEDISRGATVCLYCEKDLTSVMPAGQFVQLFGSPDQRPKAGENTSSEAEESDPP